ncbi:MAG TPA: transglycosylase domain-containing protein [Candidatus Paceibacterota bacterium]|jgi:membrane peptidoglycan carboxypeptidase|nr:transglycosylase domain-containing protein [Candidatus Paceibacterota bacterium]
MQRSFRKQKTSSPAPHSPRKGGLTKKIFLWAGLVIVSGLILLFLAVLYFAANLPTIQEISNQQISQSTKIYDRTGTVMLYEISNNNGERRTVASFDEIPQSMKDATIAIEDQNFYNEPAFDLKGILRAIYVDIKTGSLAEGGSTITQELARTAFLTLNQTVSRKLKELILAIKLNEYYSKDQILGLYLNEVPYGPNVSGVAEASEEYFNEPIQDLNIAQSALLAAIPQAPTYYSPWGPNTDELFARQKLVLQKMYDLGYISKDDLDAALSYQITFQPQVATTMKAPHFVTAVESYLVQKYGENMVDNGGLKVITTLNWTLQQQAETAVAQGVARDQSLYQGYNGALVAQDPTTGQILALVGSANYYATSSLPVGCTPGVNCKFEPNFDVATQGLRQPGSSLKPFVYMTAFQLGYTPDTTLFDVPTEFSTNSVCPAIPDLNSTNPLCFHPQNFEGDFVGPVSMRDALAQSINVPAVETLYLVGISHAVTNAYSFGLTTLTNPSQYGLSLVLGGGAVRLIDLTEAYSVLADDGVKHAQTMVLSVQDANGNYLEQYQDQTSTVADAQSVELVNDILSDAAARAPLMGASQNLTVFPGYDVALKTGTSNDYRDAWSIGYTPSLVVGVWAGNNDNTPMVKNGSSILAAVPTWNAFMTQALPEVPNTTFVQPAPTNPTKPILAGNYLANNQLHTILYYVDKSDPTGPDPTDPATDPQYHNWETDLQAWAARNMPDYSQYNQGSSAPFGAASIPTSSAQ